MLAVVAPNALTSILLLISAILIAAGLHAGPDVLVLLPVIAALGGGVTSAGLLLTRIDA